MTKPYKVNYFDLDIALKLDEKRAEARGKRRLTYDCACAIVFPRHRVKCKQGTQLGRAKSDGALPLLSVLRGFSAKVCQSCSEYKEVEVC